MNNPLVAKLRRFVDLSDDEVHAVELLSADTITLDVYQDVVCEGDKPDTVALIVEGLACRYKLSESGKRQIVGIMVPGDLCDLHVFILKEMDHSIAALTPLTVTHVSREKLLDLFETQPRITRALWWSTLVDEAILREWVMNLATRSAYERLAHLLSELCLRLETVGLSSGTECDINIRQQDLADAVGVARQQVTLTVAQLREEGLIESHRGGIKVVQLKPLMEAGLFNQQYLHLERS
jgi:CRP-like cAMP-binding protein